MKYKLGIVGGKGGKANNYLGLMTSSAPQSTFTFNGESIGAAANDRSIFAAVVMAGVLPLAGLAINSLTCGGVAMTSRLSIPSVLVDGTRRFVWTSIFNAIVDASKGTSAAFILTLSDSLAGVLRIGKVAAYGLDSLVPTDTAGSLGVNPVVANIDVQSGGFALGLVGQHEGNTASVSWSGLDEDFDVNDIHGCSLARKSFAADESNRAISATFPTLGNTVAGVFGSWK